jgi:hypothetical protein
MPRTSFDDAGRGAAEEFVRDREMVGGHAIGRRHRAHGVDETGDFDA